MASSFEASLGDDDLSRQRRKREARLLDQSVPHFPTLTLADVVADVLARSDEGRAVFDVSAYLADHGHGWQTIETVVAYLKRHGLHPAGGPDAAVRAADIPRRN
jgi:hypothetical protein